MNHEDRLSVFFISRRQGSARPAERHGEAEGAQVRVATTCEELNGDGALC